MTIVTVWQRLGQVHVAAAECAQRAGVNKRGQLLYWEYLTRLRLKDTDLLQTPDGTVVVPDLT